MHRAVVILFVLLPAVSVPVGMGAQEREFADRGALFPSSSFFVLDVGGSLRSRTELWYQVDMGLSPVPNRYGVYPQVSEKGGGESSVRESTDLRFRLHPVLHAGEAADIHFVADLLSVQAGEGGRSDMADALADAWSLPSPGGFDSTLESAYVRMLWGELRLFHLLTFRLGRVPAHWGLGLLENDASDPEADGGDAIDGVTAEASLGKGYRVSVSMDIPMEGRSVPGAYAPWGGPYDPGDQDDIIQWRFRVWREWELPGGDHTLAWGVYSRLRWQDYSSLGSRSPYEECRQYPWAPQFGCNELFWRDAFIWTPDVWGRGVFSLGKGARLRLEAELAGRYGTIGATRFLTAEPSGRTLYGMGGAARGILEVDGVSVGIEGGGATGDEGSLAFGLLDRPLVGEPDDAPGALPATTENRAVTSFALHPSFFVDRILFRRVVGAVTNAVYVRPSADMELLAGSSASLTLSASVLYASALVASATPGEAGPLGVEGDLGLVARWSGGVVARLDGAVLFPLDGLSRASSLESPVPWSVRLMFDFSF